MKLHDAEQGEQVTAHKWLVQAVREGPLRLVPCAFYQNQGVFEAELKVREDPFSVQNVPQTSEQRRNLLKSGLFTVKNVG